MSYRIISLTSCAVLAQVSLFWLPPVAAASNPERVSVSSTGAQSNPTSSGCCERPSVSRDGRHVAFRSYAPDLVPGDTNNRADVFVRDRVAGRTTRVSVGSAGQQANVDCGEWAISADGRYVAFQSGASNLVANDTNQREDVFVHDQVTGSTVRVSLGTLGEQLSERSWGVQISPTGRRVIFAVGSKTLMVHDRDLDEDGLFDEPEARATSAIDMTAVFPTPAEHDRIDREFSFSDDGRFVAVPVFGLFNGAYYTRHLLLVDRDGDGNGSFDEPGTTAVTDASGGSGVILDVEMTGDARFVVYSGHGAFIADDTNGLSDVFVYDRLAGTTRRVSVSSSGAEATGTGRSGSYRARVSADGRFVTFWSDASGLVADDPAGTFDVFLHDRDADQDGVFDEAGAISTLRLSEGLGGLPADGMSGGPDIGADGTYVAFSSFASNLVADDTNGKVDVFIVRINHAPMVSSVTANAEPLAVGAPATASAVFSDGNGDDETFSAVWHWGDGSTSAGVVTALAGSGAVVGTHQYAAAGVYSVTLTVIDSEGATAARRYDYVVVYDPSAGFVSGNALLDSPAGAFPGDPTLTGRARVSFVSRYQKGTSMPDGNAQFDFQAADLRLRSESYAWLVVAGARAQLKGTGSINGAGAYAFMLTVVDGDLPGGGGVDRVRVRIWDPVTGMTVYDNQIGDADDAGLTGEIVGGSIVIHR